MSPAHAATYMHLQSPHHIVAHSCIWLQSYQAAVRSPKHGIESIWREYTEYENSANPNIAKKVIGEFSKTYNKARQIMRPLDQKLKV
jgi:hypothetical protein